MHCSKPCYYGSSKESDVEATNIESALYFEDDEEKEEETD